MKISEGDEKLIVMLRRLGILQNIEGHRLDPAKLILFVCSHTPSSRRIPQHKARLQRQAGFRNPTPHVLSWPGGSLRLNLNSPLHGGQSIARGLIKDIKSIAEGEKRTITALCIEWPCPAVSSLKGRDKMGLLACLREHCNAKQELKSRVKNHSVALFLQVNYGKKQRIYWMSLNRYLTWYAKHAHFYEPELDL